MQGKLDSSSSGSTSSYTTGLFLLFTAQLISAYMGVVTESTYKAYGRHWGEVLFYTHILSFVFSLAFAPTILNQWHRLMAHGASMSKSSLKVIDQSTMPDDAGLATPKSLTFLPISLLQNLESYMPYVNSANRAIAAYTPTSPLALLFLNSLTQIACISGVNRLSASTTAVTVTVVLNIRKLVSFLLSCIIFGNPVSGMMAVGAGIVFAAGAVYGWDSSRSSGEKKRDGEERTGDQKQAIGNVAATASGGNAEAAGQNELRKRVT
jgi:UDP-xylose/UDP-N-acetylglucosamine transporter B4